MIIIDMYYKCKRKKDCLYYTNSPIKLHNPCLFLNVVQYAMPKNNTKSTNTSESNQEKKAESTSEKSSPTTQQKLKNPLSEVPRKYVIAGAITIVALALGGYMLSKWMIVAKVNGEAITRTEYTKELEKTAGKQVLEGLTTKKIIEQEAKTKNVSVSNEEIDAEIKKIEQQLTSQGQSLDQILAFQGLTKEGLREQIVVQKTVEKLVGDVKVATEEIDQYIEQNQELAGENTDLTTLRATAEADLKQQKTDQQIQTLLQDLRKKATIEYFTE